MLKKIFCAWLLCAFCTFSALAAEPARIVIQVSEGEPRYWNEVLGSINNIRRALDGKAQIAVVAIGQGIGLLAEDSLAANRVMDARDAGVEFVACENSMNAQGMQREHMLPGIRYTPAGYVDIVRRQQQGWAYLRP